MLNFTDLMFSEFTNTPEDKMTVSGLDEFIESFEEDHEEANKTHEEEDKADQFPVISVLLKISFSILCVYFVK